DEGVFTKQVDEGWWAMARLSTRTASPGDALQVSACLSWPGKCGYDEGVSEHLELVGVQIDMTEVTVYRSLATGAMLKRIVVPIASTSSNGLARASSESARSAAASADIVHSAVSESSGLKMAADYEYRSAPMRFDMPVATRGLFNEEHRHEFVLQIPGARDTSTKGGEGSGVLTDSRSAPVKSLACLLHMADNFVSLVYVLSMEYDLEITTTMTSMDGVHERMAVVVNGKIPMPLIKAELGDVLALRIRNRLEDEATGLHSHGLFNNGTNYYDGAGMVTECGIAPGSEMTYEIPITQTGTYWVHGHHNSQY
ncbi:ferroxidase fet3, partial [Coemansia sp. S85]